MRYLRQNTATIVTVGPFYDKTDGVTIEGSLTITNEKISFVVDNNDGSAPTLVLDNVTGATSGTDNDLNYITNCDAGLMQLELTQANTNYVGRAMLTVTDAANHCPVFHEFTILPGAVYDSLIAGTDKLAVDAQEISSDATAADNCELMFDGTGYAGGTTKLGVDVVSISGDTTAADNCELMYDGTGYAGGTTKLKVDVETIKTQTVTCAAGVTVLASVGTAATSTAQTGDAYARLGAPAGASVSADILAIDNLVDDLEGRVIGTIAAGTHNPQSGDAYARLGAPSGASVSADILAIDNLVDDLEGRVIGTIAAGTHNPQSGDAYARLGAPTGASVSADIADVESKVDDLEGRVIGTIAAGTHVAQTGDAYAVVNHVTYGNSALNTKLGTPAGASVSADILTIDNLVDDLEGRVIGTIAAGTHVAQSGDSFARLGAPAGASVSADLLAIDNLVDDLEGRVIGTIAAGTHTAQTGDAYAIVNSGTHGNAALKTLIDAIDDYVDSEIAALVAELAKVPKSDSTVTWNATALASINAEIVDALGTDALAELSAGAPSATPTMKAALMFLYMALRNKVDQTSSLTEIHNNAGTVIASAAVSDDGTTFTKAQYGAP